MKNNKFKRIKRYLLFLIPLFLVSACAYDNYSPPHSKLSGKLVYRGKPVHVAVRQVTFRLFQKGFAKRIPITVNVKPNGSYQALLFNGNYQIVIPRGQGPFIPNIGNDTLNVVVRGDTKQNVKVIPYFWITNANFSVSGRAVSVNFGLKEIVPGRAIQSVTLFVNTTRFANISHNIVSKSLSGAQITDMDSIHLTTTAIPQLSPTQNYVFAHLAVKVAGVADRLYSKVVKLQLK